MIKAGFKFKLRLSRKPIYSFAHGHEKQIFWSILAKESLLKEPISLGLSRLKVTSYSVGQKIGPRHLKRQRLRCIRS